MRLRLPHLALIALVALLVGAPSAFADALTPESGGSANADDIDLLYKITLYVAAVVFVGVEATLIYSLVKFRRRRGGPEPRQIRGNTPLEISWTVGAALILVVLAAVTFVVLPDIKDPPNSEASGLELAEGSDYATINQKQPPDGKSLEIGVNGQQYLWRYDYPGDKQLFSYHTLYVPVNTTVTLKVTSQDVVHSWWVPKMGGKVDATPGHTNETWFRAVEEGSYEGVCAELCGENHADMRTRIVVLPVDEYEAWVEQQTAAIEEAQEGLAEQRREREREQAAADEGSAADVTGSGGETTESGEDGEESSP